MGGNNVGPVVHLAGGSGKAPPMLPDRQRPDDVGGHACSGPSGDISVVDYARNDEERREKLTKLQDAYKAVFPGIREDRFQFCGAAEWVRNNLTEWLYDSKGNPIAFIALAAR
jgi:hypothetical protein